MPLSDYTTFDRTTILKKHGPLRRRYQLSITGLSGTGKTTIGKILCKHPNMTNNGAHRVDLVSGGVFMRQRACELGFGEDVGQFAAHAAANPTEGHDRDCDEFLLAEASKKHIAVFEGRLVRCWTPAAFAVLITCDIDVAAKRRAGKNGDAQNTLVELKERDAKDNKRYSELYPGCIWIPGDYDYVCVNQGKSIEDSVEEILAARQRWLTAHAANLVD